jgi:hypothetical protein
MGYALLTANSYWGLAAETTRGTAASINTYTPISEPKIEPKLTWIKDQALRGSPVMDYDEVPGVRHDEFSGKTFIYYDVFPNLWRAALGSTDTVASVGPSLWTHTIGVLNSPNVGSQPPSYTLINYSVDNTYQLLASQLSDLTLTLGADAAAEATFTFITNPYTTAASIAVNESTAHLMPAWNCGASIGGASVAVVENFEIDIKRNTAAIHTLGQQAPYRNWAGPLSVEGKMTLVVEQGVNFNAQALSRNQQQVLLQVTDPVTNYYSLVQMSACQLENPVITVGKSYISLEAAFVAVSNTTDAITGYAPIKTVSSNDISTAY